MTPSSAEDAAALFDLSVRYADAVDRRDGEAFAGLFEPDGELVVPDYPHDLAPVRSRRGRDRLVLVPQALGGYALTFHEVGNPAFRVEDDEASGVVGCTAHHVTDRPSGATDTVWFIRYEDVYRRHEGWWRFQRRALHLLWVEQRSVERVGPRWP